MTILQGWKHGGFLLYTFSRNIIARDKLFSWLAFVIYQLVMNSGNE